MILYLITSISINVFVMLMWAASIRSMNQSKRRYDEMW